MPEKRPSPLLESPPDASSSDEEEEVEEQEEEDEVNDAENEEVEEEVEEEEEEEEEEDEEDEDEEDGDDSRFTVKKHVVPSPQPQSSFMGEESDSESDSDSDLPPEKTKPSRPINNIVDPNIKPITSVSMDDNGNGNKHNKMPTAEKPKTTVTPTKRPSKRPAETTTDKQDKDSKRRKKTGDGEESEKKSSNKLWSEDDEIVILKGMVSIMKNGGKPTSDMNALLEFIKNSLHVDVTRDQLHNKIRRLKQKYQGFANREMKGEELNFTKSHDLKSYELSKKVWGEKDVRVEGSEANNGGVDLVKTEGKSRSRKAATNAVVSSKSDTIASSQVRNEVETVVEEARNLSPLPGVLNELIKFGNNSIVPPLGLGEFLAKEGLELIGSSKAKELEQKWRKLQIAETKVYLDRIELIREQTKLVFDALQSSNQ